MGKIKQFQAGNDADSLFAKVKEDDERALESLFLNYFPRLKNFAQSIVRDELLAQDIVQEIFVKLWEKRKEIRIVNIEAFLYRLVRNQCIDHVKYLKVVENKKAEIGASALFEELYRIDFVRNEPYVLIEKELNDAIEDLIRKLPDRCREVFVLSRLKGLKNAEIAQQLGINIKNVERHITRALKSFHERFAGDVPVILLLLVLKNMGY